jgi:hypothetical protein
VCIDKDVASRIMANSFVEVPITWHSRDRQTPSGSSCRR